MNGGKKCTRVARSFWILGHFISFAMALYQLPSSEHELTLNFQICLEFFYFVVLLFKSFVDIQN